MAVLNVAALFSSRKEVCGSFAIWGEKNLDAHPPNSKGIHNRFPGGGLDKGRIAKLPRQFLFFRPDERNGEITRSEEHTSELQSLMRNSYAVFCSTKKTQPNDKDRHIKLQNHRHHTA